MSVKLEEEDIDAAKNISERLTGNDNISEGVRLSVRFLEALTHPDMTVEKALRPDIIRLFNENMEFMKTIKLTTALKMPEDLKRTVY
nr:hypothetical protein [uncultured archaeon]